MYLGSRGYASFIPTCPQLSKQAMPLYAACPALLFPPQQRPSPHDAWQVPVHLCKYDVGAKPAREDQGRLLSQQIQPVLPTHFCSCKSQVPSSVVYYFVCLTDPCFSKCGPGTLHQNLPNEGADLLDADSWAPARPERTGSLGVGPVKLVLPSSPGFWSRLHSERPRFGCRARGRLSFLQLQASGCCCLQASGRDALHAPQEPSAPNSEQGPAGPGGGRRLSAEAPAQRGRRLMSRGDCARPNLEFEFLCCWTSLKSSRSVATGQMKPFLLFHIRRQQTGPAGSAPPFHSPSCLYGLQADQWTWRWLPILSVTLNYTATSGKSLDLRQPVSSSDKWGERPVAHGAVFGRRML